MNATDDLESQHMRDRASQARLIAENPHNYQICEGCDSIVRNSVVICPNCHSYRFDRDPNHIINQAFILGARRQQSVTADDLLS